MVFLTKSEQEFVNEMSAFELDRQIGLGNLYPLLINDGRIVGCEEEGHAQ